MTMGNRRASAATFLAEKKKASLEAARLKAQAEAEEREAFEEQERQREEKEESLRHEREMELAGGMRKYKTAINSMTNVLYTFDLSDENRKELEDHIAQYEKLLADSTPQEIDQEIFESHITFFSSDPMLVRVMRLWWAGMMPYLGSDQRLDREGYDVFQTALQFALNGNLNEEVAAMYCEEQFARDKVYYSTDRFDQRQFYDMLFEICTSWMEVFSAQSYTCFLWALLDSIFDTDDFPLRVRPKRCITHIAVLPEGTLFQYWFNSKPKIHKLLGLVTDKLAEDSRRAEEARLQRASSRRRMSLLRPLQSQLPDEIDQNLGNVVWDVTINPDTVSRSKKAGNRRKKAVNMLESDVEMVNFLVYKNQVDMRRVQREKEMQELEGVGRFDQMVREQEAHSEKEGGLFEARQDIVKEELKGEYRNLFFQNKIVPRRQSTFARTSDRSSWMSSMRGEGSHLGGQYRDTSMETMPMHRKKVSRGSNWIGQPKGNIFYGRGKYLLAHSQAMKEADKQEGGYQAINAEDWQGFLSLWMLRMGIKSVENMSYAMMATARSEFLNQISYNNSELVVTPGGEHVDGRRLGLIPVVDGHEKEHSSEHFYSPGARPGSPLHASMHSSSMRRNPRAVSVTVNEVRELIEVIHPHKPQVSIPQELRGPDEEDGLIMPHVVLTGNGSLGESQDKSQTMAERIGTYAPLYQYHRGKHLTSGFLRGDTAHGHGISPIGKAPMKTLLGDAWDKQGRQSAGENSDYQSSIRNKIPISPNSRANPDRRAQGLVQDWSKSHGPFSPFDSPLNSHSRTAPVLADDDSATATNSKGGRIDTAIVDDDISTIDGETVASRRSEEQEQSQSSLLSALLPINPNALARSPLPAVRAAMSTHGRAGARSPGWLRKTDARRRQHQETRTLHLSRMKERAVKSDPRTLHGHTYRGNPILTSDDAGVLQVQTLESVFERGADGEGTVADGSVISSVTEAELAGAAMTDTLGDEGGTRESAMVWEQSDGPQDPTSDSSREVQVQVPEGEGAVTPHTTSIDVPASTSHLDVASPSLLSCVDSSSLNQPPLNESLEAATPYQGTKGGVPVMTTGTESLSVSDGSLDDTCSAESTLHFPAVDKDSVVGLASTQSESFASGSIMTSGGASLRMDPRVETLAAEILHQRSKMMNAERLQNSAKKQSHMQSRMRGGKGRTPSRIPPISISGARSLDGADADNVSVGSAGSLSQMSTSSLGSLVTPSHMRGAGGSSGINVAPPHSPIRAVKNQSMEDALHERVFIGQGPSAFVGPAGFEKRWKGPSRVKHEYTPSILY